MKERAGKARAELRLRGESNTYYDFISVLLKVEALGELFLERQKGQRACKLRLHLTLA